MDGVPRGSANHGLARGVENKQHLCTHSEAVHRLAMIIVWRGHPSRTEAEGMRQVRKAGREGKNLLCFKEGRRQKNGASKKERGSAAICCFLCSMRALEQVICSASFEKKRTEEKKGTEKQRKENKKKVLELKGCQQQIAFIGKGVCHKQEWIDLLAMPA
eukprot:468816-Pelagomonas_calceolata.AAC.5